MNQSVKDIPLSTCDQIPTFAPSHKQFAGRVNQVVLMALEI